MRRLKRRGSRFIFDHHDLAPELYLSRFGRGRDPVYRALLALERVSFGIADVVVLDERDLPPNRHRTWWKGTRRRVHRSKRPGPRRFTGARPNPALKQGREHLLAYVGVIAPQDGVDYALRALALLRERRTDWRAVFLGAGDALPDMERLTVELGLEEHVEFAGWADDERVGELLSTADVGLAPDPRSPLNDASTMIKVAEYMSMAFLWLPSTFRKASSQRTARRSSSPATTRRSSLIVSRISSTIPKLRARLGAAGQHAHRGTPVVVGIRAGAAGGVPTGPHPPVCVAATVGFVAGA